MPIKKYEIKGDSRTGFFFYLAGILVQISTVLTRLRNAIIIQFKYLDFISDRIIFTTIVTIHKNSKASLNRRL